MNVIVVLSAPNGARLGGRALVIVVIGTGMDPGVIAEIGRVVLGRVLGGTGGMPPEMAHHHHEAVSAQKGGVVAVVGAGDELSAACSLAQCGLMQLEADCIGGDNCLRQVLV